MDRKLRETAYLGVEIMNSKRIQFSSPLAPCDT